MYKISIALYCQDNELYSMISNLRVEQSISQINRIIDIAVKSKNKSLSSDLERLLRNDLVGRQDYHIARLIKVTPTAKRSLILANLWRQRNTSTPTLKNLP